MFRNPLLLFIFISAMLPSILFSQESESLPEEKKNGGLMGAVGSVKGGVGGLGAGALGSVGGIVSGGLNDSIDNAVRVAENYPANVQTHILNDDHVTTVVLSIEKVANDIDQLPDQIAAAVVKILQETGDQQPEIRETLKVVDTNLGSIDNIVLSATSLTDEANQAANTATPLMRELVDLMREMNEGARLGLEKAEIEKDKPQPEPVDLMEINTLIESSTATVSELRQTVEHLRIMTGEGSIEESTLIIGEEINGLTENVFDQISGVIITFFGGLIAFIIVWYLCSAALTRYKMVMVQKKAAAITENLK